KNLTYIELAYNKEMDLCLDKLKSILKKNKNIKIKIPKNWDSLLFEEKFKFLGQSTQKISENTKKLTRFQSLLALRKLEREMESISIWLSGLKENKEINTLSENIKMIQFQIDLHKRMEVGKNTPEKLIHYDKDMLAKKERGLYPQ